MNYDKYLNIARTTGIKTHFKASIAFALFFTVIFSYYAYAFFTGSYLVTKEIINTRSGKIYSAGDILSCFFGVVFGVLALGVATPNLKAISEGKIAGKLAFSIIDR